MAVEQTDDKWTLLIGEKGNKYKSIAYYEVPEENELYLMFPFKLKDDLREFAFKKNIYAKYDNSQKAWKYSLDDKLEILEEVKRLFYGHPEMQDYLDEPESTPEPTKVNLNSVSVPTKPEIQTSPPQEQPKPVKSFKERVEERNNNNNKNKNNNTAVKIPKPKNEPMSVIDIKAEDFDNSITEKSAPETAIQVHRGAGLKLRVSVDEIVDRWKEFRRLDHELLDDTDYQEVWTPTGPKKFKKKYGMRFVEFPIFSHGEVYQDKFLLVSWEDPIITVLVHAKHVSDHFRKYFEDVWKQGKK